MTAAWMTCQYLLYTFSQASIFLVCLSLFDSFAGSVMFFFRTSCSQDLVATGCLRADQIARTLVPSLLRKAEKLKRGCKRTGCMDVSDAGGLQELGFLLGQRSSGLKSKNYLSSVDPVMHLTNNFDHFLSMNIKDIFYLQPRHIQGI